MKAKTIKVSKIKEMISSFEAESERQSENYSSCNENEKERVYKNLFMLTCKIDALKDILTNK